MSSFNFNDEMLYKSKYIKYKNKYIELKNQQIGGDEFGFFGTGTILFFFNRESFPAMDDIAKKYCEVRLGDKSLTEIDDPKKKGAKKTISVVAYSKQKYVIPYTEINGLENVYIYKIKKDTQLSLHKGFENKNITDKIIPFFYLKIDPIIKILNFFKANKASYLNLINTLPNIELTKIKEHTEKIKNQTITLEQQSLEIINPLSSENLIKAGAEIITVINKAQDTSADKKKSIMELLKLIDGFEKLFGEPFKNITKIHQGVDENVVLKKVDRFIVLTNLKINYKTGLSFNIINSGSYERVNNCSGDLEIISPSNTGPAPAPEQ
jgi:hypothetical protein